MFDTYGLNIYPVLTNPEIRVDFVCPPGWNCLRPDDVVVKPEGEEKTHCDLPTGCDDPLPRPGGNQCDLNTYVINKAITEGLGGLRPQLSVTVGNDAQTVNCTDLGFEDNGFSETREADKHFITKEVLAVPLGSGSGESIQSVVCGLAGPIQYTYQFPAWLINKPEVIAAAKTEMNAAAKAKALELFQAKIATGEYPMCNNTWTVLSISCASEEAGGGPGFVPPGINFGILSMDCSPPAGACPSFGGCEDGATPPNFSWGFIATHAIGPYPEDRTITLTGTYSALRTAVANPCSTGPATVRGTAQVEIQFIGGVTDYSGDFNVNSVGTSLGSSGLLLMTATLPAGQVTTVRLNTSSTTWVSAANVFARFNITVVP